MLLPKLPLAYSGHQYCVVAEVVVVVAAVAFSLHERIFWEGSVNQSLPALSLFFAEII